MQSIIPYPPTDNRISVINVYRNIKENKYDLNASYQRGVVWDNKKQSLLINSLYLHYIVPPVIISKRFNASGKIIDVVMDGKQRLTSIVSFMDNKIPLIIYLDDQKEQKEYYWYSIIPAGAKKPSFLLTDNNKILFEDRTIPIMEYRNLTEKQEHEQFSRIQNGVLLTSAEKLKALSDSPLKILLSDIIAKHKNDVCLLLNNNRQKDMAIIAKCIFITYHKITTLASINSQDRINKYIETGKSSIKYNGMVFDNFNKMGNLPKIQADIKAKIIYHPLNFLIYYIIINFNDTSMTITDDSTEQYYIRVIDRLKKREINLTSINKDAMTAIIGEVDALKFL